MRIAALGLTVLMLGLYYAHGLPFQVWPDSGGYLHQALGMTGAVPYARTGDRSLGYPALVALTLATPAPALALVLAQALLTVLSFLAVYLALTRLALPRLLPGSPDGRRTRAAILLGLAAATLYSVIHVQIAALLTETLFTFLVLVAVLAVVRLSLADRVIRRPWLEAAWVAALVGLPLLVKPHWQLAAPLLALVIGIVLYSRLGDGPRSRLARWGLAVLALAMPLLVVGLVALPDRTLAVRHGARDAALFGPRTAFCNHAHLVQAARERRPLLSLDADPAFDEDLGRHLARMVSSHSTGWRLLGFNGDLCTFDRDFSAFLDRRFAEPDAQRRFLLGALLQAAVADPVPFARKVLVQAGHGFLSAFGRFAIHARPGPEAYRAAVAAYPLPPGFASGVRLAPEIGPLGTKAALDGTLAGRAVQGFLAVLFHVATAVLVVLALASLVLPLARWRAWPGGVRAHYLSLVALPLAALLAHHGLVALVHSFDVWRYGFNMFYVNLFFMGSAAMFWLADWQRWRHRRQGPAISSG